MAPPCVVITWDDVLAHVKLSYQVPSIVEGIVTRKLIEAAASAANLAVEADELQATADRLRLAHDLDSVEATWAWLNQHGLSKDEFQQSISLSVLSMKLAEHLFMDQVEPYFFSHQLDYAGLVMYEVVLDDLDLAMEFFYAIQEGETTLQEVARQYVSDLELRRTGGYRGVVKRHDLKPEISAAGFAAHPPQLLKPIVTSQGVHLIYIEAHIQPELDATLRVQILSELYAAWLKEQIEQADIITPFLPDLSEIAASGPTR